METNLSCTNCGEEQPHTKIGESRGKCQECGRTVIYQEVFQQME